MKINNINFTGIRNTSSIGFINNNDKNIKTNILNTQLKDDEYGNDLTDYRNIIKKFPMFKNRFYSNFINIFTVNHHGTYVIRMNGVDIPETDEFLPLFSFVGKLSRKISQMPDKGFVIDKKYIESKYADKALLGKSISAETDYQSEQFLLALHAPENIKYYAKNIDNDIYCCMLEYIG